jgi:small conductance mechanosensitive channel
VNASTGVVAAQLPDYVHDHSRWIIETPVRIALIVICAWLLRVFLNRFIDRLTKPSQGTSVPRILRPFKERAQQSTLLRDSGLISERRAQRAATIASVLKSTIGFTILIVATLLILSELQVNLLPFVAGTSIVGLALGFGAQNIVKDFLAGMFIMIEDQYGVGDVIEVDQTAATTMTLGTVEAVGMRTTRVRAEDGTAWYLRNGEIMRVGNRSQ